MAETSYNGWPASPDKAAIGVVPFGDAYGLPFPGGVKAGDVHTVLGYVATQFHYRVEAVVEGWDWGYSYRANVNNPSTLSCHASGTALDLNAPLHPNGAAGTFTSAQVVAIREILAEVAGAVNWLEGYDEMHFEIQVDADTLAGIAATLPGPGPAPPTEKDWFDMATEDDLRRIVDERLEFWLPRMLNTMMNGHGNQAFTSDAAHPRHTIAVDTMGVWGRLQRLPQVLRLGQGNKAYNAEDGVTKGVDNVGIDGLIRQYGTE